MMSHTARQFPMSRCRRMTYLLPGIGARITFMAMGRSITRATSLLVTVPSPAITADSRPANSRISDERCARPSRIHDARPPPRAAFESRREPAAAGQDRNPQATNREIPDHLAHPVHSRALAVRASPEPSARPPRLTDIVSRAGSGSVQPLGLFLLGVSFVTPSYERSGLGV